MEPNKFDNHIKSLLESREMQPSEAAWSKLSSRLDEDEKPNHKKWFWLSGLAASIIGVLLLINLYNPIKTQPEIVDIKTIEFENTEHIKNTILENEELNSTELVVDNSADNRTDNTVGNGAIKTNDETITKASNVIKNKKNKKRIVNTVVENNKVDVIENKSAIKNKINENTLALVDAAIQEPKQESNVLNETDRLLNQALLAVTTPKTETIDAASLLYDVEVEVEQTFRTKMFAKIKDNAMDLKTIIVNRNK
jgi:hypothetical protein